MSRGIPDSQLELMHLHVSHRLRQVTTNDHKRKKKDPIYVEVDARILSPLLDELKQRRRRGDGKSGAFNISPVTRVLIGMKVGETVEIEPITHGALTTLRNTARRHLGIPDAVWHSKTLDSGIVRVTRMPDGSNLHADYSNPAIKQMAEMKVGDVVTLTTLKSKIHNGIKIRAKKLMDNAEANWKCENLANGHVRCRRTR